MDEANNVLPLSTVPEVNDMLTEVIRQGAKQMLSAAIESEVQSFLSSCSELKDERGRRLVVRNGYLPPRDVQTGVGDVPVKMPRVRNNSEKEIVFASKILPPYLKRTKSLEELIPWLYLRGISTGDMQASLSALLGKKATGLSAKNIGHLTAAWQDEYAHWVQRDLSRLKIVYVWADGVYLKARMDDKQCLLVLVGADDTGKKHVLALSTGERESKISWHDVLLDLKNRGLKQAPKIAVGDGALGFWGALSQARRVAHY